jgi:excisionase family DNA binding protein
MTPERHDTLDEVAERYRFKPRYLRELVRKRQIPVLRSGRLIRFDALAVNALEEALRCPSKSSAANRQARSQSLALSPVAAYSAALKATIPSSPKRKRRHSKPNYSAPPGMANVVVLAPSPKL